MKYYIYTIEDKVAEASGYPFVSRNDGTAARVFRDFIQRQTSGLAKDEFRLLKIGIWDEELAKITPTENAIIVEVSLPPSVKE